LRWQGETQRLKSIHGDGPVTAYGTWYPNNAYGGAIHYGIHCVELLLELLGPRWSELRLEESGPAPRFSLMVEGVRAGIAFEAADESDTSRFGVRVGARDYPIVLGNDYMAPVTDRIAAMLRTGDAGMSAEELLAPIRLMAAIDRLLAA
jgi:predicted dehydrogenase